MSFYYSKRRLAAFLRRFRSGFLSHPDYLEYQMKEEDYKTLIEDEPDSDGIDLNNDNETEPELNIVTLSVVVSPPAKEDVEIQPVHWNPLRALRYKYPQFDFYFNMSVIIILTMVAESSRGIIIPTIKTYNQTLGGDSRTLGAVVACFSVGRLIASVIFGYMSQWSVKMVLILCLLISIVGNVLYALALPFNSIALFIVARCITGFGTGTLSVSRGYIATNTTIEKRTKYISFSGAAQFLGFAVMPGLGSFFVDVSAYIGKLPLNGFTLPGYFMSIVNALLLVAVLVMKVEPKKPTESTQQNPVDQRLLKWGIVLFLFLNFIVRGVLGIAETIMPPMQLALHGLDDSDALQDSGQYFLVLGGVGFLVYLSVDYLLKVIKEQHLLSISIVIAAIGFFFTMDFDNDQTMPFFTIGAFLVWSLASPLSQTLVVSSFSKMLGSKPQGSFMGWITAAGSGGRILFPLLSGFIIAPFSFLIGSILCLSCVVSIYAFEYFKKRLQRRAELHIQI